MGFEHLKIKDYNYWVVYLHENQCYLGRCVVWCKRDIIDFFDMSGEEREEFWMVARHLRDVLKKLFSPDLMNYASLGNEVRHLHVHVTPRYEKPREFSGVEFVDKRWGKSSRDFKPKKLISGQTVQSIKKAIQEQL